MDDQVTPRQFVVFLFALLSGGVLVSMYWYWAFGSGPAGWVIGAARIVKRLLTVSPVVMSRTEDERPPIGASVLRTDVGRTSDGRAPVIKRAEKYLTLCKLMREAGIKRDDALAAFKACGIPFNNGVWADAAPPAEEPAHVTPIAQRPTDAEFPYEELTR